MKPNRVILIVVSFALLGALCIAAYFRVRNQIVDRFWTLYFVRGSELTAEQANHLEQEARSDPSALSTRIQLLAYYSFKAGGMNAGELSSRRNHILWIIEHEPTAQFAGSHAAAFGPWSPDPEGFRKGADLWNQQILARPHDVRIFYNASQYFSWGDEPDRSRELLERAYAIDPNKHDVASSLASAYWQRAKTATDPKLLKSSAEQSVQTYKQALSIATGVSERLRDLPQAVQAAFEAGDFDLATTWANEALQISSSPEIGDQGADAVHYANIVLGRIALRRGDIGTASAHLVKAGGIAGAPHLNTFGPNMMLAKELLEKGETKSVLEYFDACAKFWKDDEGKLKEWKSEVKQGKLPDFGNNLRY